MLNKNLRMKKEKMMLIQNIMLIKLMEHHSKILTFRYAIIDSTDNTDVDDLYSHIKQMEEYQINQGKKDGILLFKVTENIDPNIISKHILDSRKSAPNEAESDNPTQFHYETKVLGDDIGSGANNDGDEKRFS